MNIELRRVSGTWQFGQRRAHERNLLHVRRAVRQNRDLILFNQTPGLPSGREHLERHLHLRFNFQLGSQIANAHDQILQDCHLCLGSGIELFLVRLRIVRQRNRLCRSFALVYRLPDFFGDEWHDRMQQA